METRSSRKGTMASIEKHEIPAANIGPSSLKKSTKLLKRIFTLISGPPPA
jgi:hypothetical protein